jgi:hypothetical protein
MDQRSSSPEDFAQKETKEDEQDDTIFSCIADAGFTREEVRNWGRRGSLVEALQIERNDEHEGFTLDEQALLDFVANLPTGNPERPEIRHEIQNSPAA